MCPLRLQGEFQNAGWPIRALSRHREAVRQLLTKTSGLASATKTQGLESLFWGLEMIFMAKLCPKAIYFAIAESIHQLLVLKPHPIVQWIIWVKIHLSTMRLFCLWWSPQFTPENIKKASLGSREKSEELKWFEPTEIYFSLLRPHNFSFGMG